MCSGMGPGKKGNHTAKPGDWEQDNHFTNIPMFDLLADFTSNKTIDLTS